VADSPVRLDKLIIMRRLTAMIESVTDFSYVDEEGVTRSVTYDLTGRVYRGRKTVSVVDAKDAVSILEAPRSIVGDPAGLEGVLRGEPWTLNIQGWPVEDRENPSDPAYVMAAAVRQRLSSLIAVSRETGEAVNSDEFRFGNIVNSVAFGATIVVPPTEGLSAVTFWYIPLIISLVQRT